MEQVLKHAVLQQLHEGRDKAIPGKLLSKRLNTGERAIRLAIRELIFDGVAIIGSARTPYGYFIAETTQEAEEELEFMRSYVINCALHRRDFKRAARKLLQPHQLNLI